jgi:hypothetical protein
VHPLGHTKTWRDLVQFFFGPFNLTWIVVQVLTLVLQVLLELL